jgi:hypothetical protein
MVAIGRQLPEVYLHRRRGCECVQVPLYLKVDVDMMWYVCTSDAGFQYFVSPVKHRVDDEVDLVQGRRRGWLWGVIVEQKYVAQVLSR